MNEILIFAYIPYYKTDVIQKHRDILSFTYNSFTYNEFLNHRNRKIKYKAFFLYFRSFYK